MKSQTSLSGLDPVIKNKITAIVKSEEQFPVDLEVAADWIGYKHKKNAKLTLVKNFIKNVDYSSLTLKGKREIGATRKEVIKITEDCFKSLCMMAHSERGRQMRRYFLEIERLYIEELKAKEQNQDKFKEMFNTAKFTEFEKQLTAILDDYERLLREPKVDPAKYIKLLEEKAELLEKSINKPKKVFRRVTADEQAQIIDLWKTKKYTLNELSRKVGRGAATVRAELMAAGLYKPTTK